MTKNKHFQIAIDGPASSGKSTVSRILAEKLGITYLDTGAMYRAATLVALQNNWTEAQEIIAYLILHPIRFDGEKVFIGDQDVTLGIRQKDIDVEVSRISALPEIRDYLLSEQRRIADRVSIIMDGRDIGTVVLPHADLKIYLVAAVDERAERRHKENREKGISSDLDDLKKEIAQRDKLDASRTTAPLKQALDAYRLDTTGRPIADVVAFIEDRARELLTP